ncbi:MAG TPA: biotin--[acetyl-CoA-carboxylase] ligase [Phycisphaerae bacterium]|nr:biotin--[acetyl-CoA-carboxylase] ligase [Phycisphaerae bacterium]HRW51687.1 biotin--[acetyl-CoA-carboxylase] ligase [Phycisphaerae bacterium]
MQSFTFDSLDSTNDQAKRMIAAGELTADAYVVAREQTAGRGTKGRAWVSPRDSGLYMSVVLFHVRTTPQAIQRITLACGVACAQTLRRRFDIDVRVKPVNDLILEGGKLGGILTEASYEAGVIRSLIVGVGINLRPTDLGAVAAPLGPAFIEPALASPRRIDRAALAASLADALAAIVSSIGADANADLPAAWRGVMVG